jgi:hypothetical protein
MVVTTVVEHPANLLPWARLCRRRFVEYGTFTPSEVAATLDDGAPARLLAVTGASNVTGWTPPLEDVVSAAHDRGVPVLVPRRPNSPPSALPAEARSEAWRTGGRWASDPAGTV